MLDTLEDVSHQNEDKMSPINNANDKNLEAFNSRNGSIFGNSVANGSSFEIDELSNSNYQVVQI